MSLIYMLNTTTSEYTDSTVIPSVMGPTAALVCIIIGMIAAYYSNKLCSKDFSNVNPDYLTAGEKTVDKREWGMIEMTLLKAGVS